MSESPPSYAQKTGSYLPDIHRVLPHSSDAEKGLLCSFLLASDAFDDCLDIEPGHLHIPAHGTVLRVLGEMRTAQRPTDFITLTAELHTRGLLDTVGGAGFISDLFTFLPTAANVRYYAAIVREKHTLRQIIVTGTEAVARAYDDQDDAAGHLEAFEQAVLAISRGETEDAAESNKQLALDALADIEALYERKGEIGGVSTGFHELDKMTDGLHGSEMIVIAARPSMGKTAIVMNIAEHVALTCKKHVGIFSLEMSNEQLVRRMICSRAHVNLQRVIDGFSA